MGTKARLLSVGLTFAVTLFVLLGASAPVLADEGIRAKLRGFQETPAVSTVARGDFRGKISKDEDSIDFTLSYEDLEGTVTQSHIHFAQRGVAGGISIWLCQTATNPAPASVAGLTPTCPASPGTVSGTLTAANVIGPSGQGIAAGEFAEVLRALRAGVTYANVHSTKFPAGEIRGQIKASRHDEDDD